MSRKEFSRIRKINLQLGICKVRLLIMTTILSKAEISKPLTPSKARTRLLKRFEDRIAVNEQLDRRLVSFQANREVPFYGWFKYKEGFSARLVEYFLQTLTLERGVLLDPFAGAGSALFAARDMGWDATGIELLPVGQFSIRARLATDKVASTLFEKAIAEIAALDFSAYWNDENSLRHVQITEGAFPEKNERELVGYIGYCQSQIKNGNLRNLLLYAAFCVLESLSYTRKDGQYLRWDYRSNRSRGNKEFDKGEILDFRKAITAKLRQMAEDMKAQSLFEHPLRGAIDVRSGSCLDILPTMADEQFDFVLTSPPYCNRYDYTRTYALELVFGGCTQEQMNSLRQQMLSCTVENREKQGYLRSSYLSRGHLERWERVDAAFQKQAALHEVLDVLNEYKAMDMLNNANIVRMIENYFYEMAFVVLELGRTLKPGGKAVIVNDNVRYAGEEVPADLILSAFAEDFGFRVRHIWTLPRGKGNSSQQMGSHGRSELRKCVYVWEKA
jgi:DNA modification methylase